MNSMSPMIGISLLVGFVVAGLVWYGWGAIENFCTVLKRNWEKRKLAAAKKQGVDEGEEIGRRSRPETEAKRK